MTGIKLMLWGIYLEILAFGVAPAGAPREAVLFILVAGGLLVGVGLILREDNE